MKKIKFPTKFPSKFPKLKFNPFRIKVEKKVEGTAGVFFGSDKPMGLTADRINMLMELFFAKYAEFRERMKEPQVPQEINDRRFNKERLYDFYRHMDQGTFSGFNGGYEEDGQLQPNTFRVGNTVSGTLQSPRSPEDIQDANTLANKASAPVRVQKKPIEVFNELERIPNPVNLTNLQANIDLLHKKVGLANQIYTQYNLKAAIECLENRKKYTEFAEFFERFPYTYSEKIENLLSTYNLVLKTSEIFVPEFPAEAIEIMDAYQEMTKKICEKKPVFYVIATDEQFAEKYKKRDPILLVQSPFGFYWQILGAWDTEMMMLSEL